MLAQRPGQRRPAASVASMVDSGKSPCSNAYCSCHAHAVVAGSGHQRQQRKGFLPTPSMHSLSFNTTISVSFLPAPMNAFRICQCGRSQLHVCLSVCLPTCLSICLFVWQLVCSSTCLAFWLAGDLAGSSLSSFLSVCLFVVCLFTYLSLICQPICRQFAYLYGIGLCRLALAARSSCHLQAT